MTLNEAFPTNEFFSLMSSLPWGASPQAVYLDQMFFSEYGDRQVSKLVSKNLSNGDVCLNHIQQTLVAEIVKTRFVNNWTKKFNVLNASYDPINNYDITESQEGHTDDTTSRTGTVSDSGNDSSNTTENVFGEDTTVASPSTSSVESTTKSSTNTQNLADDRDVDRHLEISRSGVDGNTTRQKLLEDEITLWDWNFFSGVFKDSSELVTIPLY